MTDTADIIPITKKAKNSSAKKIALEDMNKRFAVVCIGGAVRVADFSYETPRYLSVNDFKTLMDNVFIEEEEETQEGETKTRRKKIAAVWLSWKNRRQYDNVEFAPNLSVEERTYNLWKGWKFEPEEGGKFDMFLDHCKANICNGDEVLYNWVLDWLADMFQRPERKNGVALVLRSSAEGTGKGRFATTISNLINMANYVHILQAQQLVGKFNAQLQYKILAFVDEAFWGGDQQAKGALYGMITEPYLNIEAKNKDADFKRSFIRFIMATNLTWAVPANSTARRFCVLDVAENSIRNRPYFTAMETQLTEHDNAGYKALLSFLLNRKYNENVFSDVPKTNALLDQKLNGISDELRWWHEVLLTRRIGDYDPWDCNPLSPSVECNTFFNAYLKWGENAKIRHPKTSVWLTRNINEYGGLNKNKIGLKRVSAGALGTSTHYDLEKIELYRDAFEERLCQSINWEE